LFISGLASAIVVIEAPKSSGALATARFAIEQNRDVFVAPGPPLHPQYVGSHALIKSGAALVTSAEDILDALGIQKNELTTTLTLNNNIKLDENEKLIINVLKATNASLGIQAIADQSAIDAPLVSQALGTLVLQGIVRDDRGKFSLL